MGQYKLSIVDNGDGMSPEEMDEYLNSLAVQGASQNQGISQNFGVGAKVTALYRNRHGLVYQSWRDGRGAMLKLHRDDKEGIYGLYPFLLEDGPDYTPRIKDTVKPKIIDTNGTKVTLLGASEDENTCFPPEDTGGGMNWLIKYLTGRYFRFPENIKLQVRVLTRDEDGWPSKEPDSTEKTYNLQTVRGAKVLFDHYCSAHGTLRLATADAHWWVFDDPRQTSKDMSSRGGRTCQTGIVFQDEVYIQRTPPASRRILAGFGIVFGAEHVVIYVEPREPLDVRADTARSRLIINGEDIEEASWWEIWGTEFRSKMPDRIRVKIDEIMARTDRDPEGKTRERILERLRRIRELLRPSRYRRDPAGPVLAQGKAIGGDYHSGDNNAQGTGHHSAGGRHGGRSSDDYLADLVASDGENSSPIVTNPQAPEVKWISRSDGTREEGELDDRAAEISGDVLTSNLIKANSDFRGFLDIVRFLSKEFNPAGDDAIHRKIVEYVQEWMEAQLVEAVMVVRNLINGRTWSRRDIQEALSPQALTAVVLNRFHLVERVKRSLNSDLAKTTRAA